MKKIIEPICWAVFVVVTVALAIVVPIVAVGYSLVVEMTEYFNNIIP